MSAGEVHGKAMEVAVMSLSARENLLLESIESRLVGSDPGLASMLDTFTRLTLGEDMPVREVIRPRHCSSLQKRRGPRGLVKRLGRPQAALLVWLVISIALLATALAVSRSAGGARGACVASFAVRCGKPAPTHRTSPSAVGFAPGTPSSAIWSR
jgi:hypothetical protein